MSMPISPSSLSSPAPGSRQKLHASGESGNRAAPGHFGADDRSREDELFGPLSRYSFPGRRLETDGIASCYIFLASDDAIAMTGLVRRPAGGEVVSG
jgi:hypothetical protein